MPGRKLRIGGWSLKTPCAIGPEPLHLIGGIDRYEDFATRLNRLLRTKISADVQDRKSGHRFDLPDHVAEQAHRLPGEEYHWFNKFVATSA